MCVIFIISELILHYSGHDPDASPDHIVVFAYSAEILSQPGFGARQIFWCEKGLIYAQLKITTTDIWSTHRQILSHGRQMPLHGLGQLQRRTDKYNHKHKHS